MISLHIVKNVSALLYFFSFQRRNFIPCFSFNFSPYCRLPLFFHDHIPPGATQNVQIDHPNDIPLVAVAIQMIKHGQFGVREEPKSILKNQFWQELHLGNVWPGLWLHLLPRITSLMAILEPLNCKKKVLMMFEVPYDKVLVLVKLNLGPISGRLNLVLIQL